MRGYCAFTLPGFAPFTARQRFSYIATALAMNERAGIVCDSGSIWPLILRFLSPASIAMRKRR
jgi:hypothetical protein